MVRRGFILLANAAKVVIDQDKEAFGYFVVETTNDAAMFPAT
jgi:hypothetical protein